jgi:hypothetical protein
MMFPFGKPVAEPTSDAIQASHGAAQLLHRIPLFPLARATFLRFCPSQSHLGWRFSSGGISSCEAHFS